VRHKKEKNSKGDPSENGGQRPCAFGQKEHLMDHTAKEKNLPWVPRGERLVFKKKKKGKPRVVQQKKAGAADGEGAIAAGKKSETSGSSYLRWYWPVEQRDETKIRTNRKTAHRMRPR